MSTAKRPISVIIIRVVPKTMRMHASHVFIKMSDILLIETTNFVNVYRFYKQDV